MFKINRLHCFQRRLSRLLSFGVLGLSLVAALPMQAQSPSQAWPNRAVRVAQCRLPMDFSGAAH